MACEDELLDELERNFPRGEIVIEPSADRYCVIVEARFPFAGSKIDWDRVPTGQLRRVDDMQRYNADAVAFADEVIASERLDRAREVVVFGDNSMETALRMELSTLRQCLDSILDLPQHTYVIAPDGAWCMVFTMEGDFCFGYAVD